MFTYHDPTVPRRESSAADFPATMVSLEVDRRRAGLRAEADARRLAASSPNGLRLRLGHGIVHLGEAVSGVRLHQHPMGHRAG